MLEQPIRRLSRALLVILGNALAPVWLAACCLACVLACVSACAGPGAFVWVNELPREQVARAGGDYLIRDGDTVNIRVFGQEGLSARAKVRSDGRLSIPALGDIDVRGKRPSALKAELEGRLKDYVNAPSVTVSVEEFQPIVVSVLGEVSKVGTYPVDPRASVAQVLATAGGLTDFATRDRIFVVRAVTPQAIRVRFTYDDISRGEPSSASFTLRDGDLLVVE
jgi:polysaccharide export outer membrane protein